MPVITLKFKDKTILDHPLAIGQNCSIGRKTTNDIVIDNMAVSGSHARIEAVASTFVIRDLDSTNGTFVNKKKVSMHNLRHRDLILIGKHTLLFDLSDTIPKSDLDDGFEGDDKTRILDTSEYRELIKSESGKIESPQPQVKPQPPPVATPVEEDRRSWFKQLVHRFWG
ncbi:FHA domain-containing protein [Desulfopila sp. IMCC35008]|uniref:FHA domain-containing protein n=1 Tax=Desulfopila sp. IMCC35008 TaxID=2653858 RepID=UPI0013D26283|nr:FHA domain-containing protein [Desulfopila sp. IMCC35008]